MSLDHEKKLKIKDFLTRMKYLMNEYGAEFKNYGVELYFKDLGYIGEIEDQISHLEIIDPDGVVICQGKKLE